MPTSRPVAALEGALDVPAVVPGAVCHRGVTYVAREGYRPLLMDVHVPLGATAAPCVLWIHGGAWWSGDRREQPSNWRRPGVLFSLLVEAGLAVATVDYRLSREAAWPAQYEDVAEALRFLRAHADLLRVDPARVAAAGDSAGGHLAAMLALRGTGPTAVQAAALLYAVTDLRDFDVSATLSPEELLASPEGLLMGVLPDDDPDRWTDASPISHVHADAPPTLLITGDADLVVPARQSVRMHEALVAAGAGDVVLDLVPGADHCFGGVDEEEPLRRTVAFLADRLRR